MKRDRAITGSIDKAVRSWTYHGRVALSLLPGAMWCVSNVQKARDCHNCVRTARLNDPCLNEVVNLLGFRPSGNQLCTASENADDGSPATTCGRRNLQKRVLLRAVSPASLSINTILDD